LTPNESERIHFHVMDAHQEQGRSRRSRLRVLEAALSLFAQKGYEGTTIQHIAREADVSIGLVCRYFPTKEHFALALYDRLASALEGWATEMPEGTAADRFGATLEKKLALLEPHRRTLLALSARAIDPRARAHVFGAATEVVRSKVAGVFWLAVADATDAPPREEGERLARLLYGVHLLIVLLFLQDEDPQRKTAMGALDIARSAVSLRAFLVGPLGARVDALFGTAFGTSRVLAPGATARTVLGRVFHRRRVLPGVPAEPSEGAWALHLPRVQSFVDAGEPIQLVLPGFPAKAPNRQKVLGKLPDTGEAVALESLQELLVAIAEAHPSGAELVLCSDGHVFADVVGVSDADVAAYRRALEAMIDAMATDRIRVFGLEDAFGALSPNKARRALMDTYGVSGAETQARAEASPSQRALVDGIHRFLFEDEVAAHPELSRTQARKATRQRAYEVVRRSEAWGQLVAAAFPRALRLSIHPQPDVSSKIGIALVPSDDAWLTPWHGVALVGGERVRLLRRRDAEALGAVVVEEDGRPMHMEMPSS
jgi:pyoverdine/dityrosine biosynthesis protein Dit1/AcrR family transcriptional regulator